MEWLFGLIVTVVASFWQYVLSAGAGIVLGMILLRILLPATLLAAFSASVRRLYARMQRSVAA
ncbi:MAG TPA: hypothetical protein PKO09_03420 [Anaerolineae bacterium]|nr:hypothetical protein [Anaerolineae bacterium]